MASSCFWKKGEWESKVEEKKKSELFFSFPDSFSFHHPKKQKKTPPQISHQQAHPERVDVDAVVVVLVVQLGRHELRRSQHRLRRRPRAQQRREAEVADLDDALAAVDEDVVALEVAVDDRRGVAVQVDEAAENLPGPALQDLGELNKSNELTGSRAACVRNEEKRMKKK